MAIRHHDAVELVEERAEPDPQEALEEQRARDGIEGVVGIAGLEDVAGPRL